MIRILLSIAFFAGFVIGGGSAFAQARPDKAPKPEALQIAQAGTEQPSEAEPGDDRAAREQEVRQGAGEAGDDRGGEAELRGRAAEGEQEIENEGEHQHRGRDRDRGRDHDRSGPDRGRDGGGGHGRDGGGHGGRQ